MLGLIGGLLGGLGGLFGNDEESESTTTENFEVDRDSNTKAWGKDLNDELLAQLEKLMGTQVGSGQAEMASGALATRLQQLLAMSEEKGFDVNTYRDGVMKQAVAGARLDLESNLNGLMADVGSSTGSNSMAALLENRMRNMTAANLAGINSEATATGEGIRLEQQKAITEGINASSGNLASQIMAIIQATRGASQRGESVTKEHSEGTSTSHTKSSGSSGGGLGGFFSGLGNAFSGFKGV